LRATARPRRGYSRSFCRASTVSMASVERAADSKTRANSRGRVRRRRLEKAELFVAAPAGQPAPSMQLTGRGVHGLSHAVGSAPCAHSSWPCAHGNRASACDADCWAGRCVSWLRTPAAKTGNLTQRPFACQ
jgi:hypothetical protein